MGNTPGRGLRVEDIVVYPVKACRGVSCKAALASPLGLSSDRRWMIVKDDEKGNFISQRQCAKLCLVAVSLPEPALLGLWDEMPADAALELTAPGQPAPLRVPLRPASGQPLRNVCVWDFTGRAYDEGPEAAVWLSTYIGEPARLVRYAGSSPAPADDSGGGALPLVRPTDPEFAPGQEVAFADGYPLLVATQEDLAAVSKASGVKLDMARFRPNLVVAGAGAAWETDSWRRIAVGPAGAAAAGSDGEGGGTAAAAPLQLDFVKPCDRCKVPTIDPQTAQEGDQPLKALHQTRTGKLLGWSEGRKSWTHAVFFAWNAVPRGSAVIRVGDPVEVVEAAPWGSSLSRAA